MSVSSPLHWLRSFARSTRGFHRRRIPVYEVHPEISFAVLLGAPASAPKKSWAGMCERRRALEGAGLTLDHIHGDAATTGRRRRHARRHGRSMECTADCPRAGVDDPRPRTDQDLTDGLSQSGPDRRSGTFGSGRTAPDCVPKIGRGRQRQGGLKRAHGGISLHRVGCRSCAVGQTAGFAIGAADRALRRCSAKARATQFSLDPAGGQADAAASCAPA